jgi:hypothetical protein
MVGSGLGAGTIQLTVNTVPVAQIATGDGHFSYTYRVPLGSAPGPRTVIAFNPSSGRRAGATFTVLSPGTASTFRPSNPALSSQPVTVTGRQQVREPARKGQQAAHLWVALSARMLRPGDRLWVNVGYRARARVQLTLMVGRRAILKTAARLNGNGRLRIALRLPLIPLRTGHGTATLTVAAASSQNHTHVTERLVLAMMILSVRKERVQGCRATLVAHVAYISRAQLHLAVQYEGQPQGGTHQTLQTDRHGHALAHLPVRFVTRRWMLPVRITATGQRGHLRQTESSRLTVAVPGACRHLGTRPA